MPQLLLHQGSWTNACNDRDALCCGNSVKNSPKLRIARITSPEAVRKEAQHGCLLNTGYILGHSQVTLAACVLLDTNQSSCGASAALACKHVMGSATNMGRGLFGSRHLWTIAACHRLEASFPRRSQGLWHPCPPGCWTATLTFLRLHRSANCEH